MTKPKYKDTEESEAADKCKNDQNAVTNLDFLFQRKDTESEFVDTVRNDDITAELYIDNVTDERAEISNTFVFDRQRIAYIRPTTVGIRVKKNF